MLRRKRLPVFVAFGAALAVLLSAVSRFPDPSSVRIGEVAETVGQHHIRNFTVVVNTFRRDTCLDSRLRHWLSCRPQQVRLAWNDVGRPHPDFLERLLREYAGNLIVDDHESRNLTNRFLPLDFITEAVFSVDDDIVYSCRDLWAAFEVWQHHPYQMVGFSPRYIEETDEYKPFTTYSTWGSNKANTLFVTKGGFLHRSMFSAFFNPGLVELRAAVDAATTAEDLLMSFMVAAQATSRELAKPVFVWNYDSNSVDCSQGREAHRDGPQSKRPAEDKGALTNLPDSVARRLNLTRQFHAHFGFPFVTTTFEEFYHFDAGSGKFKLRSEILGPWCYGLNPLYYLRLRALWLDRGHNCCI